MLYRGNDKSRLSRDEHNAIEYKGILERGGPLKRSNKIQSKDIFLLALAFGYMNNVAAEINNDEKFLRATNFEDVLPVLINAIALEKNDNDINILSSDDSIVFKPSEEYANAGFELLKSKYVQNEESFIEELRFNILKMNIENDILNKLNDLNI